MYLHIGRGLYYGSYKSPRVLVWSLGTIILVMIIIIAFMGFNGPKLVYIYNTDITTIQYVSFSIPVISSSRLKNILHKHNIQPILLFEDLTNPSTKNLLINHLNLFPVSI